MLHWITYLTFYKYKDSPVRLRPDCLEENVCKSASKAPPRQRGTARQPDTFRVAFCRVGIVCLSPEPRRRNPCEEEKRLPVDGRDIETI